MRHNYWPNSVRLDDEHSDREPERRRHVYVFLRDADGRCQGGRNWNVTRQQLGSVRVSYVAHKIPALHFCRKVDLRHAAYGIRSLRRCHLSNLAEQQRKFRYRLHNYCSLAVGEGFNRS